MMPKNKIGRHMMAKLKLFVGPNHTHQAQCPIPLEALSGRPTPMGAIFVTPPKTKEMEPEAAVAAAADPAVAPHVPASPPEAGDA
jgi:large subunit ribosomal protein L13